MDGVVLNSLVEDERWKYDAVKEALRAQNLDPEAVSKRDLRRFLGDFGREECIEVCEENNLDPSRVWELVAETTNLARINKVKQGEFEVYDDARGFLESLRPRGVSLGMVSNAPEAAVKTTMRFFDMERYFSYYRGVESFEDLKQRKPHPKHLEIAKAELKKQPFLYIGDKPSDIRAGNRAGMDSALIKRNCTGDDISPDFEVDDLEELGRELSVL